MDAVERGRRRKSKWDVLFGLQLGVIGGFLMLAWFALISPILGYPWWLILNASASHFYAVRDVNLGPGVITIVGAAAQIFSAGVVGCISGLLTPAGRLWGIAAAIVWYAFCLLFVWKRLAPMLLAHSIQPVLWAGYFIFGSVLGWRGHLVMQQRREAAL